MPELKLRSIDRVLEDIACVDSDLHRRLLSARKQGEAELRKRILEELRASGLNDRAIEALVGQLKRC